MSIEDKNLFIKFFESYDSNISQENSKIEDINKIRININNYSNNNKKG